MTKNIQEIFNLLKSSFDLREKQTNAAFFILNDVSNFNELDAQKSSLKKKVCSYRETHLITYTPPSSSIKIDDFISNMQDLFAKQNFIVDKLEKGIAIKKYPRKLKLPTEEIECVLGAIRYENYAITFCIALVNISETDCEIGKRHLYNDYFAYHDTLGPGLIGRVHTFEYKKSEV